MTIDQVENLIKKHEAFEKSAIAQEERFCALERLTTFELKEIQRRKEEEERKRQEELAKQAAQAEAEAAEKAAAEEASEADGKLAKDGEGRPASIRKPPPTNLALTSPIEKPTADQSATEADGEILEGILNRKHEWESTTKKASNRSWDKVFVCVQGSNLAFYKDAKTAKTSPETYFKGEAPIDLHGGTADVATDYTKKKFVLRAKLASGAEFLFQARNEAEMRQWVSTLKNVCEQDAAGTQSRSQTLPAVGDKRDEPKRRSFFTLKKV
uniref:Spectrin beta chain n=1 Tax=Schizaphis graminum TaxID=13262 RepID=A0A2S2PIK0_SCHGA